MRGKLQFTAPAKLIIEKDKMWTENVNRAKRIGDIDVKSFSPYPKDPKIAKFFKEIGLVDVIIPLENKDKSVSQSVSLEEKIVEYCVSPN